MKKKVLIITSGVPNHGGAATTMFNLEKLLQSEFDSKLVYLNKDDLLKRDALISNDVLEINKSKNIFWRLAKQLKNSYILFCRLLGIDGRETLKKLNNIILKITSQINSFALNRFLQSKKISPDIIISNVPSYFMLLNKTKAKHKIIIVNGCAEMGELSDKNINACHFLEHPEVLNSVNKKDYDFTKLQVIFNSPITKRIYETMNVRMKNSAVRHFNLTPVSESANKPFHERKIQLAYFVSNTSRKIKNAELAIRMFEQFPQHTKICIGKESVIFKDIPNTSVKEIIPQHDLFELMNDVKLVIIPSFYDSSPGILTEAISRGCNVLISKNIGWNEYLDAACVVDDFNNFNEWINKADTLMNQHKKNEAFIEMVNQSPAEILSFFKNLDV